MKWKTAAVILSALVTMSACKDDKVTQPDPVVQTLKVTMQPVYGSNDITLNDTVSTVEGYKVKFTEIKCYFSSLKNGSKELISAALYDYHQRGTLVFQTTGNPYDFSAISGYLGVDAAYNHDDPSAFPNDNALNIMVANDMHWDWNPGYIFMKVEAKVDTIPDGTINMDHYVTFHIGADPMLQNLSFTGLNWVSNGNNTYTLPLKLDMQKFLQNGIQTIDLKTEYTSHSLAGQESLSLKVIQNFASSISPY
jgi:archaellin